MVDSRPERIHDGLSPSSLGLFLGCNRKYYYKKIAKTPIDIDASEDTEALRVGSAFHKCLENTKHALDGFTLTAAQAVVCGEFELSEAVHLPLIFAMLGRYKETHRKAGLKVLSCEVVIDNPYFYGIVDAVMEDSKGRWWIVDMKTAATYSPQMLIPTLPRHPQLSLYAQYHAAVASKLGLDSESYQGCRYRLTTKSKLIRKATEPMAGYIERLSGSVRSLDIVIPKALMEPAVMAEIHGTAKEYINTHQEAHQYSPNYGNCTQWFRSCEYWSKCHGKTVTAMKDLEVVEG